MADSFDNPLLDNPLEDFAREAPVRHVEPVKPVLKAVVKPNPSVVKSKEVKIERDARNMIVKIDGRPVRRNSEGLIEAVE